MSRIVNESYKYFEEMLHYLSDEHFLHDVQREHLENLMKENDGMASYIETFHSLNDYYNYRIKYYNKLIFSYKKRCIQALEDCEALVYNPYRQTEMNALAKKHWVKYKEEELISNKIIKNKGVL
ncbi:hypothetical protein ACFQ4Z_12085 [Oceanobacillus oncorhynchi subsp. oncorhynchi]|uniref:hypothetical protein n=1 Tax=Oceanobacillus oncorhynchi TaxID=545501 RepID=UPI003639BCE6